MENSDVEVTFYDGEYLTICYNLPAFVMLLCFCVACISVPEQVIDWKHITSDITCYLLMGNIILPNRY